MRNFSGNDDSKCKIIFTYLPFPKSASVNLIFSLTMYDTGVQWEMLFEGKMIKICNDIVIDHSSIS